jgi:hypothetical protein
MFPTFDESILKQKLPSASIGQGVFVSATWGRLNSSPKFLIELNLIGKTLQPHPTAGEFLTSPLGGGCKFHLWFASHARLSVSSGFDLQ